MPPSCVSFSTSMALRAQRLHARMQAKIHSDVSHTQGRSFNTSRSAAAHAPTIMPKNVMRNMPLQQAPKSQMKHASANQIPDDIGLFPQTFIRPANKSLPRLFSSEWKRRLGTEWFWIKSRFVNLASLVYYLRWVEKDPLSNKRIKNPLRFRERGRTARQLHKQFYTALAAGDMSTIRKIGCTGLTESASIRIAQRPSGAPSQTYTLVKYNGITYPQWLRWPLLSILPFHSTKIISDRIAMLPVGKNNTMRQVVVRIRSRQALVPVEGKGAKVRDLTEYVVIQRSKINGEEKGWKLWGTTKQSSMEDIEAMMGQERKDLSFMDRIEHIGGNLMSGNMGKP